MTRHACACGLEKFPDGTCRGGCHLYRKHKRQAAATANAQRAHERDCLARLDYRELRRGITTYEDRKMIPVLEPQSRRQRQAMAKRRGVKSR